MKDQVIGFIGGGNMASSLVGGLLMDGFAAQNLWVADPSTEKLTRLEKRGVNTTTHNPLVAEKADVVVFAVKPQNMREAVEGVSAEINRHKPLLVSIAAGIRTEALSRWLNYPAAIVRCMPNTPALVQSGATALYANAQVSAEQRNTAESVMRAVGLTVWVEEEGLLDTVTALSGSGPAYFFLLMEAMEKAACQLGLDPRAARLLTQQTALGAAKLALESNESPAELRKRVTSPGGTTQKALEVFERADLSASVFEALRAAKERSIELSNELGEKQ